MVKEKYMNNPASSLSMETSRPIIGATHLDKIIEMAGKEIDAMRNINEINFNDFFQSRIIKTKADTTLGYSVKVALKLVGIPIYFGAFKLYQFGKSIDYP